MKFKVTSKGFGIIVHKKYPSEIDETRLVQESSAIDDSEEEFFNPGSSFLWIGQDHHLGRNEVKKLIQYLQHWIDTGKLSC